MATETELDELLGEEEAETETPKASPADEKTKEKPSAADEYEKLIKKKQALQLEAERLEKTVAELRETRRSLDVHGKNTTPESKTTEEPQDQKQSLDTVDDWMKYIRKTSNDTVSGEFQKLKETQKAKAIRDFTRRHSEYAVSQDQDDSNLKKLLGKYEQVKSRSDLDREDILEDLEDSWAVLHRSELYEREQKIKGERARAEEYSADVATSTAVGSERSEKGEVELNASAEDKRIAKKLGKSLEEYMKLKTQWEASRLILP